ncbi:MAG: mechanosensitive ion channel family protein [Eubacteriales bacterium]
MKIHERAMAKFITEVEEIAGSVVESIFIILIGVILLKICLFIVRKILLKSNIDVSLHRFILNIIKVLICIVILISVCGAVGINTTSFVAVLGAAGAAVALALKDSLANIAGGIIIIITKPFKMGDFVDLGDTCGVVQEIDLLYTILKTYDNQVISVPNGKITTSVIKNASFEETRRVDLVFSISYDDDFDKAKETLEKLAKSNSDIFSDPEPFIGIAAYNDSSIDIDFRVWCDTEKYAQIKYYITNNVKKYFDTAGISIPFPHIEIITKCDS